MQNHDNANVNLYDIKVMKVLMIWIGSSNKILSKAINVYTYRNDLKEKLKWVTCSKKKKKKTKEKLCLLQRRDNVAYEVRLIVTNTKTLFATTKR